MSTANSPSWIASLFSPMKAEQPSGIDSLGFKFLSPSEASSINPAMGKAATSQIANMANDATQGELGVILHPDGQTWSHEVSVGVDNPVGSGFVNIPLLTANQKSDALLRILMGKPSPDDIRAASLRAAQRVKGGAILPSYPTPEAADAAAQAREEQFWKETREGRKTR